MFGLWNTAVLRQFFSHRLRVWYSCRFLLLSGFLSEYLELDAKEKGRNHAPRYHGDLEVEMSFSLSPSHSIFIYLSLYLDLNDKEKERIPTPEDHEDLEFGWLSLISLWIWIWVWIWIGMRRRKEGSIYLFIFPIFLFLPLFIPLRNFSCLYFSISLFLYYTFLILHEWFLFTYLSNLISWRRILSNGPKILKLRSWHRRIYLWIFSMSIYISFCPSIRG